MHLIMYCSRYTGKPEDCQTDLKDILDTARENNPKHDITGVLFYDKGQFIQVLEGEKEVIERLLSTIKEDERHDEVEILMDHQIKDRELDQWNMKAFDLSSTSETDWSLLKEFRNIYLQNFKVSATQIIKLLQRFIQDSSSFERFRS